jgi:hypothetical protein
MVRTWLISSLYFIKAHSSRHRPYGYSAGLLRFLAEAVLQPRSPTLVPSGQILTALNRCRGMHKLMGNALIGQLQRTPSR